MGEEVGIRSHSRLHATWARIAAFVLERWRVAPTTRPLPRPEPTCVVRVGSFGGSGITTASGQAIAVNLAGDSVYITGTFSGTGSLNIGGSVAALAGVTNPAAFVIKLNGLGESQWARR